MWAALGVQVGSALLGQAMSGWFEEEMDWSGLTEQTGNVIGSLQKTFDYLTGPDGGFAQKEKLIDLTQDLDIDQVNQKFKNVAGKAVDQGEALIASTGFAQSGVAENKVSQMYTNIQEDYTAKMDATGVKHEMQDYEFDMSKFETLAELEKEMNQILGTYVGTTGERFGGQRQIEGLAHELGDIGGGSYGG